MSEKISLDSSESVFYRLKLCPFLNRDIFSNLFFELVEGCICFITVYLL